MRSSREIEIALPHELTDEQRKWLVTDFVRENFQRRGMVADVNIHAPDKNGDSRNYHAHILLTLREIGPDGFGPKVREWNSREQLGKWRENWANLANRYLERFGHEARIDHCTLEAQGIEREPGKHRGPDLAGMEQRGQRSEVQERREREAAVNDNHSAHLTRLRAELAQVARAIGDVKREREPLTAPRVADPNVETVTNRRAAAKNRDETPTAERLEKSLSRIGELALDTLADLGSAFLDKAGDLLSGGRQPFTPQERAEQAASTAYQSWKTAAANAERQSSATQSIDRQRWMSDAEYRKQVMANERVAAAREIEERLRREREEQSERARRAGREL